MLTPSIRSWDALKPLGEEYGRIIAGGLKGGWVDRYENKGKRSGAFSAGSYKGDPYILMNYKEDDLRHVFTLAHEGGHSMHSWFSVRHNPFQTYNYTIFEAEVASTFNEQLLARYLADRSESREMTLFSAGTADRRYSGDHLPADHVCRIRTALPQPGGGGTAPDGGYPAERVPSAVGKVLRRRCGSGGGRGPGRAPDPALLPGPTMSTSTPPAFLPPWLCPRWSWKGEMRSGNATWASSSRGAVASPLDSLKNAGVDMSRPDAVNRALGRFSVLVDQLEKELLG